MEYFPRVIDKTIDEYLDAIGALLIRGPKWCGKTTSATQKAKSIVKFQDENERAYYDKIMALTPNEILEGEVPRLIDEWQVYPVVWNCVRNEVDNRNKTGQFILTGSATPVKMNSLHTGTGRIGKITMYPMSLYESKESNGKISLKEIFYNSKLKIDGIKSDLTLKDIVFACCRGGWPSSINLPSDKSKLLVAKEYYKSVCEEDISNVDNIAKDPVRAKLILKAYARGVETLTSNSTLLKDINVNDKNVSESTLYSYLNAFKKIYVIDEIEAWCPNIRSKSAIRSLNKKSFVDPSIAVAALGLSPELLMKDLNTLGFIFENLVIRDLKVYSSSLGADISYYRDRYGLECDCVMHLEDGKYALIEIKLGDAFVDEGVKNLVKLKNLIKEHNQEDKTSKIAEPDILMIITGGQHAYTTEEGVIVVPIGCLKD